MLQGQAEVGDIQTGGHGVGTARRAERRAVDVGVEEEVAGREQRSPVRAFRLGDADVRGHTAEDHEQEDQGAERPPPPVVTAALLQRLPARKDHRTLLLNGTAKPAARVGRPACPCGLRR